MDLDTRVSCPDESIVGISSSGSSDGIVSKNKFAEVSIDSKTGYGPETITIRRWTDTESDSKIGGHYEFYANWYRD